MPGRASRLDARVRRFAEPDFDDLVRRWHETNLASYPYCAEHQRHSLEDAFAVFRGRILVQCEVWVAEASAALLGLMALRAPWIDQFAVFPEHQRRGVGTALLGKARERSPRELRLYTFQRNERARAFYERHGFLAVGFGVSPAPESEPDVEYRWIA
jgi:ribosomal protein S18 acetylase RimI-like enzyme